MRALLFLIKGNEGDLVLIASSRHSVIVSLMFGLVLLLTWFVYQPGLSGPFLLDDFDNLSALSSGVESIEDVRHYLNIGNAGPLGRPISKLSFLLDDNNWPSNPEYFKPTNLAIHLLIGVVGFMLLRTLGRSVLTARAADYVALAAAAIWLVHPMQVSTVLYIVQRMTQLSMLFVLVAVLMHVWLRRAYPEPTFSQLCLLSLSLGFFTLLSMLSKESGALLPVYVLVLEATIFSRTTASRLFLWWKRINLVLPTLMIFGYVFYFPKWIVNYSNRDFTLSERILTQFVVLWDYIESLFDLEVHKLGLFQDDYPVFLSVWQPEVLLGMLGLLFLLALAFVFRKKYAVFSFGVFWFFAGHIIESSAVSLELYFEHRNYLPYFGLIFSVVFYVFIFLRKFLKEIRGFEFVVLLLMVFIPAGVTWGYSSEWGDSRRILPIWASEHPESLRAQRTFSQHMASVGFPEAALDILDDTYEAFPYDLSLPLMSLSFSCAFERPVRYDMNELVERFDQYRWTDGLRPVVSNLSDFIHKTSCAHLAPEVASVLEKTVAWEGRGTNRGGVAALQVIAGDLFLNSGKADEALTLYLKVDQMVPSPDSATRLAGLYLRAGQYSDARKMLEIAIERDASNGISETKMKRYINTFEIIDSNLKKKDS